MLRQKQKDRPLLHKSTMGDRLAGPREASDTTALDAPDVGDLATGADIDAPTLIASGYRRRDFLLRRLLAVADGLGILLALTVAEAMRDSPGVGLHIVLGALMIPGWLLILNAYGLYTRDARRVSHSTVDDIPSLFHAVGIGTLLLWIYFRLVPDQQLSFIEVVSFALAAITLILLLRSLVRRHAGRWLGTERVLIVGAHETRDLLTKILRHPEYGLEPVGIISDNGIDKHSLWIASMADVRLEEVVADHRIDHLIVSRTDVDEETMLALLRQSRQLGLKLTILPQLFDVMGPSVEVDDVEGITVLGIHPPVLLRSQRAMKRALDVVGAAILALALSPVMLAAAIAIKLDSDGPILFRQERVGKRGRYFRLVKFRTMCIDAESGRAELLARSADANWLLLEDDPRVTRIGRFLRRTSLDEVPQLWNILRGDMSLVGPRPLPLDEDRQVSGWGRGRLDIKPGMSGHWQVLGRTAIPFEEMVKLDYLYVTNWSLWADVRLMLHTVPAVLSRRGTN